MKVEYDLNWFTANADEFDKWFDAETFDWWYSYLLAKYCSKHFNKWWNVDKFNWVLVKYLPRYCSDHFDLWWDASKYNWNFCDPLTIWCVKDFKKWFDPDKFNWKESKGQLRYSCLDYVSIWYDSSKFEESYDELLIKSIK
tara:strand:- start:730 stop:1152 length:423 start_codon:yes stop_codon:yes gene_type:complete